MLIFLCNEIDLNFENFFLPFPLFLFQGLQYLKSLNMFPSPKGGSGDGATSPQKQQVSPKKQKSCLAAVYVTTRSSITKPCKSDGSNKGLMMDEETRVKLRRRCGFFDNSIDFSNYIICDYHYNNLIKMFKSWHQHNTTCLNPNHAFVKKTVAKTKAKPGSLISPEKSEEIWYHIKFLIPENGFVCWTCQQDLEKKIEPYKMAQKRKELDDALAECKVATQEAKRVTQEAKRSRIDDSGDMDVFETQSLSQAVSDVDLGTKSGETLPSLPSLPSLPDDHSKDPNFVLAKDKQNVQSAREIKLEAFQTILETDGLPFQHLRSILYTDIDKIGKERKRQIFSTQANIIKAMFSTLLGDEHQDQDFPCWIGLKESNYVEKLLLGKPVPPTFLKEVIGYV